jgi:hypothetical protein
MVNMGDDAEIAYVCCVHLQNLECRAQQDNGKTVEEKEIWLLNSKNGHACGNYAPKPGSNVRLMK